MFVVYNLLEILLLLWKKIVVIALAVVLIKAVYVARFSSL